MDGKYSQYLQKHVSNVLVIFKKCYIIIILRNMQPNPNCKSIQYGSLWSLYSLSLICIVGIALSLVTNHTVKMFIYSYIDCVLNSNLSESVFS